MSIRNLDKMFNPASIALIGASAQRGTIGGTALRNLRRGGFAGQLLLVNAEHRSLAGHPVFPDIESLPATPELAVIATPPETVPGIVAELGARGTRAAIILSGGYRAPGDRAIGDRGPGNPGTALTQAVLDAAKPYLMRLLGPGSVGLMVPRLGVDASFAHLSAMAGDLAFISQSAAMVGAVLDWAATHRIGFSNVVALGDTADVDFGDVIDYLGRDQHTSAILLYIEGITGARKFMSAARAAARGKPVLAVKGGRFAEGARAATSHLGVLAGSDAVYDAAFRRAGMLRATSLTDLFDAVETLAQTRTQRGGRLAVLTNGGGPGVLATDAATERGLEMAELSPDSIARLDTVLPARRSRTNPIDLGADAPATAYAEAIKILLEDRQVDGILALHSPTALADGAAAADAVIAAIAAAPSWQLMGRNVITSWLGSRSAGTARRRFAAAHIASYATPESAIHGFAQRIDYRRNQELLLETPAARPENIAPDVDRVRTILRGAIDAGRGTLDAAELAAVLEAYGIPAAPVRIVADADAAAAAVSGFGGPVALKIISPDVAHKSEVGGVVLNLKNPDRVRQEAAAMAARLRAAHPAARIDGFLVQRMADRPGALELFVGVQDDAVFGPAVIFGQGGTTVELLHDTTIELPPLNAALAHAQLARTRVWQLMQGYRGQTPVDVEAVIDTLLRVAQLAVDHPELREFEINPLLADASGVVAVDTRLRVAPATGTAARLAISPYPKEFEDRATLRDGSRLQLRPIRPEDEPLLQDIANHMGSDDLRLRFFVPTRGLSHILAARLSQIDYDREMALVALTEDGTTALGVVRFSADPDNRRAEYAVALRSDWKGRGLGWLLMTKLIDVARRRGIGELTGDVLRENGAMLRMCQALGFTLGAHPQDPELVRVVKPLMFATGG